jgi:hypothetical protein
MNPPLGRLANGSLITLDAAAAPWMQNLTCTLVCGLDPTPHAIACSEHALDAHTWWEVLASHVGEDSQPPHLVRNNDAIVLRHRVSGRFLAVRDNKVMCVREDEMRERERETLHWDITLLQALTSTGMRVCECVCVCVYVCERESV